MSCIEIFGKVNSISNCVFAYMSCQYPAVNLVTSTVWLKKNPLQNILQVPIARGCQQAILIGDQCQLPPTDTGLKAWVRCNQLHFRILCTWCSNFEGTPSSSRVDLMIIDINLFDRINVQFLESPWLWEARVALAVASPKVNKWMGFHVWPIEVLSDVAETENLGESLFTRLVTQGVRPAERFRVGRGVIDSERKLVQNQRKEKQRNLCLKISYTLQSTSRLLDEGHVIWSCGQLWTWKLQVYSSWSLYHSLACNENACEVMIIRNLLGSPQNQQSVASYVLYFKNRKKHFS